MAAITGHFRDYREQVDMKEAFRRLFANYVEFSGRSNRGEFWWAVLAVLLINLGLTLVDRVLLGAETFEPLSSLWSLATLLPSLALAVRRLHDTDRSGWWVTLPLGLWLCSMGVLMLGLFPVAVLFGILALVAGIVLIVWYCEQGAPQPNRFG